MVRPRYQSLRGPGLEASHRNMSANILQGRGGDGIELTAGKGTDTRMGSAGVYDLSDGGADP